MSVWYKCGKKKLPNVVIQSSSIQEAVKRTNFSIGQVEELYKKFKQITVDKEFLSKEHFREMMGFIENPNSMLIVDRIYLSIKSKDNQGILFEEFVVYLDTLIRGNTDTKTELCYYLIDTKKRDYFFLQDMINLVLSILQANSNSHNHIEHDYKAFRISSYLFQRFDPNKEGKVTKDQFKNIVSKDPNLLEIFTLLNKGISEAIISQTIEEDRKILFIKQITHIRNSLKELKKMTDGKHSIRHGQSASQLGSSRREKPEILNDLKSVSSHSEEGLKEVNHMVQSMNPKNISSKFDKVPRNESQNASFSDDELRKSGFRKKKFMDRSLIQKIDGIANADGANHRSSGFVQERNDSPAEQTFQKNHRRSKSEHKEHSQSPEAKNLEFAEDRFVTFNNLEKNLDQQSVKSQDKVGLKNSMAFSIPDEGVLMQKLPKDVKIPFYKTAFLIFANPFSEVEKVMQTFTSQYENESGQDENELMHLNQSGLARPQGASPRIFNKIPTMIKNSMSLTPEIQSKHKDDYQHLENEGYNRESDVLGNRAAKRKIKDLLSYTETLLEGLETEYKLLDKKKQTYELTGNPLNRMLQNIPKRAKSKKDTMVFLFHKDWNLVINMMIGINKAIRALWDVNDHQLQKSDYKMRDIFELNYKRSFSDNIGLKGTCIFYNYAPYIFADIRSQFNISNDDYLGSIGSEALITSLMKGELSTFSALTSSGKSGSFIFYSIDGRFILKTIRKDEYRYLKSILNDYHKHISDNRDSLIPKFFGLHKILFTSKKIANEIGQSTIYFCIMANILGTAKKMQEMFDLKGSTHNRGLTKAQEAELEQGKTKYAQKDNDFIKKRKTLFCSRKDKVALDEIIHKDVQFFIRNNIIDYSLLVGIHKVTKENEKNS